MKDASAQPARLSKQPVNVAGSQYAHVIGALEEAADGAPAQILWDEVDQVGGLVSIEEQKLYWSKTHAAWRVDGQAAFLIDEDGIISGSVRLGFGAFDTDFIEPLSTWRVPFPDADLAPYPFSFPFAGFTGSAATQEIVVAVDPSNATLSDIVVSLLLQPIGMQP